MTTRCPCRLALVLLPLVCLLRAIGLAYGGSRIRFRYASLFSTRVFRTSTETPTEQVRPAEDPGPSPNTGGIAPPALEGKTARCSGSDRKVASGRNNQGVNRRSVGIDVRGLPVKRPGRAWAGFGSD